MICCVFIDTAADGANAGVPGDEILSTSISASVLDAPASDMHADNRMSEMVDNDASEKCNLLVCLLDLLLCVCVVNALVTFMIHLLQH